MRLRFASHLPVAEAVQLRHALRLLRVEADQENILVSVAVEIGERIFRIICVHQLDNVPIGERIDAERLDNLIRQLTANEDLHTALVVELDIFRAGKGRAAALDDGDVLIRAVDQVEDVGPERLIAAGLQKDDGLVLSIAVEIGELDGLLVRAGHRRGIRRALGHQAVNGILQIIILIGMFRQRIKLVHCLHKAPAQHQREQQRQDADDQYFSFHTASLLSAVPN